MYVAGVGDEALGSYWYSGIFNKYMLWQNYFLLCKNFYLCKFLRSEKRRLDDII